MCRLLANHVISITPFPVRLHHSNHSNRSGQGDYIKAIVQCRKHPEEGPRKLAAMLVEEHGRGRIACLKTCNSYNFQKGSIDLDLLLFRRVRAIRWVSVSKGYTKESKV